MKEQLEKLFNHNSLSFTETQDAFSEIFEGKVDPVVLGSFLTALKMNGYSADEIGGAATAMAYTISKGWKKMIVPAMMVGVLGYILGNYYGAIVWSIIH